MSVDELADQFLRDGFMTVQHADCSRYEISSDVEWSLVAQVESSFAALALSRVGRRAPAGVHVVPHYAHSATMSEAAQYFTDYGGSMLRLQQLLGRFPVVGSWAAQLIRPRSLNLIMGSSRMTSKRRWWRHCIVVAVDCRQDPPVLTQIDSYTNQAARHFRLPRVQPLTRAIAASIGVSSRHVRSVSTQRQSSTDDCLYQSAKVIEGIVDGDQGLLCLL